VCFAIYRGVEKLAFRQSHKLKVVGSNPTPATMNKYQMKIKLPEDLLWMCPVAVPDLVRLGGKMDGGYLVPQRAIDHAQGLLSFGLGDDFTFDQDWHRLKPQDPIHMYDASVKYESLSIRINTGVRGHIDIKSEYQQFFQGSVRHWEEYIGPDNFVQALDRMGVDQVFIKMDIEGSEYPLIDLFVEHHRRIAGIAIEWHNCANRDSRWKAAVDKLSEHYDIVHLHGNNHVTPDNDGIFGCMELTHVRRDLVESTELRKQIHITDLDYSNVHGQDDYEYYFE